MSAETDAKAVMDPATVLSWTTKARTLTVSDQHANILLTVNEKEKTTTKSALLKLTVVPFHKNDLMPPAPHREATTDHEANDSNDKSKVAEEEEEHSTKVLKYLSQFGWRMTSESGEEYSYHEAFPIMVMTNTTTTTTADEEPIAKRAKTEELSDAKIVPTTTTFKAELIYPASEKQVQRTMPFPGAAMVTETPELYKTIVKPYIDSIVAQGSLKWLQNIVQVKKEKERLLLNADQWILNIDTKWRTHPDPLTVVDRKKWFQHESVADLYCLGIVKQDGIASLRDLTADHLPMLRDMLDQGPKVIQDIYGVKPDQLRIFVHYQPQFYHFHVHFTRLENDISSQVERAHLLSDIVQDLKQATDYFRTRSLTYKLGVQEQLYKLIQAANDESK